MNWWVSFYFIFFCFSAMPSNDPFEVFRTLYNKNEKVAALNELENLSLSSHKDKKLQRFAKAVLLHKNQRFTESKKEFEQSLKDLPTMKAYILMHQAEQAQHYKKNDQAEGLYSEVLQLKSQRNLKYEARFALSELLLEKRAAKAAAKHLYYLERRWRGSHRHPEVVWRLINAELLRGRSAKACRWARKMYSKYAAHPLIYDWQINLKKVKHKVSLTQSKNQRKRVRDKFLNCTATHSDQQRRVRRLQLSGESLRAKKEIDELRSQTESSEIYPVDVLEARYLIQEGGAAQALKILLTHYKKQKKNFKYLMLLGKAASRSGQFQTAVGAYYKGFKNRPNSKKGRKALFRAAFLSYQFQDYDGASRKFHEFIKKNPHSGLSRDAKWHLAWIRYLRGDHIGASRSFEKLLKAKKRYRRKWRKLSEERLRYWLAMSYYRQKKFEKARPILEKLSQDKLLSYYSLASQFRLKSMPSIKSRAVASTGGEHQLDLEFSLMSESENDEEEVEFQEDENESSVEQDEEDEADSQDVANNSEADFLDPLLKKNKEAFVIGEQTVLKAEEELKDGPFKERYARALHFINLGFFQWAKWELYEIEKRTRRQEFLKLLMSAYEKINSYNRSSYIGQLHFANDRRKHGVQGARYLWIYSYPQAFSDKVRKYSSAFRVPKEFVWSIMRAESKYKHDVQSPVGAQGLMQIMPYTGERVANLLGEVTFRPRDLIEPEVNVRIGTRYLKRLLKKFDDQIPLAAAGYNAGPHRVESWLHSFGTLEMDEFIEHIPFVETRNYVKKVVRNYSIYNRIYNNDFEVSQFLAKKIRYRSDELPKHKETWEKIGE